MSQHVFDASEWDNDEQLESGSNPLPGKYHVVVQQVDDTFSKSNSCLLVTFEVLNGTVPGQTARQHTERVPVRPSDNGSKAGMRRGGKFLRAVGLLSAADMGKPVPINFQDAVGRDLVIELEKDKEGKYTNCSFLGFWPTNHEDVRDVPKGSYRSPGSQDGYASQGGYAAPPQGQQAQQQAAPNGNVPNGAAPNGSAPTSSYVPPQQAQQPQQQTHPQPAGGGQDWGSI